jgi:ribonuclease T
MTATAALTQLHERFRGYYPVVIDVETGGFNASTDALLEIAAITLKMDKNGWLVPDQTFHFHVSPFEGANLEPAALAFTGIDPYSALRGAVSEHEALEQIFKGVRKGLKANGCQRAIVVAHNASFDHGFVMAAAERAGIKRNPFHPFATFDTATLAGLALGQTVLAKACKTAGMSFDNKEAHSALYDTSKTAELFCRIVNRWKELGGWPLAPIETDIENEDNSGPAESTPSI